MTTAVETVRDEPLTIGGRTFQSRLMVGTGKYPDMDTMVRAIEASGAEVNVLLGKGIARIADVVQELKRINYGGLVAIEYEKEGKVEEDVRIEVEYARSLL